MAIGLRRCLTLGHAAAGWVLAVVLCVWPVLTHLARPRFMQDRHGIDHVLVEQLVVLDHGLDAWMADDRRA